MDTAEAYIMERLVAVPPQKSVSHVSASQVVGSNIGRGFRYLRCLKDW